MQPTSTLVNRHNSGLLVARWPLIFLTLLPLVLHALPGVAQTTILALRLMTQVQALGEPQGGQRKESRSTKEVAVPQLVPSKCLADLRLVAHGSLEITAAHCRPCP